MRKILFALLILAMLSLASTGVEQFETQTEGSPFEIAKDWRVLAALALMLSIILVAIAYAIGIGFEMPEIQGWASAELSQIIVNAILIVSLIIVIAFVDSLVIGIAQTSLLYEAEECWGGGDPGVSCLQSVTNLYLSDYVDTGKSKLKSILRENIKTVNSMNTRTGLYCTSIYCAQIGITMTWAGQYVLDVDMNTILFEYYTNLLAFMESQLFFVNQICFKMAPILLAVGIVGRSFFFTRKLGGLLMAISIGLMFFFPGMYIFDWVTLDMTINGDKAMDKDVVDCPSECSKGMPMAYYYDAANELHLFYTPIEIKTAFNTDEATKALELAEGSVYSYFGTSSNSSAFSRVVYSCNWEYLAGAECPTMCRVLPYPAISQCLNASANTQEACAAIPAECKVARLVEDLDWNEYYNCPKSCKVVPPLRSDCDVCQGDDSGKCCLDSSLDCRVTTYNDLSWRATTEAKGKEAACNKAKYCPAPPQDLSDPYDLDAYESCVYVMPETGMCDELCMDCPTYCRFTDEANLSSVPIECKDGDELIAQCRECHETCKLNVTKIEELGPVSPMCDDCPPEKRLMGSGLPDNYTSNGCSFANCSANYRMYAPRAACEMCLFSEESYAYNPPINNQCDAQCKPQDNIPVKDAESYSKIGEEGLVGKTDIQDLSKMMLPAYVLPLFNIVATLVFIKELSRILSGDIEIPGISKVF
ncbi:hypothetical protein KKB44_03365 [Candidatus Micrarchaeota archaeon]|nr:hypothetical protein [Candidatus Micrarchaeota archaeon]